jgi:hypothetical protein
MEKFVVVYQEVGVLLMAAGPKVGIYSDFFAMSYWADSFGFVAVIACLALFVVG